MHISDCDLKAEIIYIIKNTKRVSKAINKIAKLKEDGESIGIKDAKKIYIKHAKHAVKYDEELYGYNNKVFKQLIKDKKDEARNYQS